MRRLLPLLAGCGFILLAGSPFAEAQKKKDKNPYAPPEVIMPSDEVLGAIADKTAQLAEKIAELRANGQRKLAGGNLTTYDLLPDVEIFLRGAENIVRFKEFYNKASGQWTLDALDAGLKRADQLAKGDTPWTKLATRNVLRAYRSSVDGTAQPYGVTYPLDYGKDQKRRRVDVVLHGRNNTLTEVWFLNSHNGKKKIAADQDWVQIDIYGRGNNAYRWAGETDVFEALEAFFRNEFNAERFESVDRSRLVLRGFSMGGAGAWHLGLRFPTEWRVMGPGAGFTTTHGYAGGLPKVLPDYQEKCLRIYDAIDYSENARMIPIVAYSGGDDPQKLAADNIENRLKEFKIDRMTHLVAPGLGHTMPVEWFKKANDLWSEHAAKGREQFPQKVSFVTHSTKAAKCAWVMIFGMDKHYEKATVNGELTEQGCRLTTKNVQTLMVWLPRPSPATVVQIDGQEVKGKPLERVMFLLTKQDGDQWKAKELDVFYKEMQAGSGKVPGLQGPIDDAFTQGFVCVIGSGDTFHPATQKFVDAKLKAFEYDWAKHWRGKLPTTGDYAVTPNDIMGKNLILFGDPQSNLTLAQIMPKLPIKWTKDEIEFAGKKYKASEHVPVMIFPNPLNPTKYVVLNTGHTFPSEDYVKTNALLYPRLGDYAILRMTPTAKDGAAYEFATAGLFDEFWGIEKK